MCSTPTQHDWELTVGASLQQHGSCGCSCAIVRLRRSLLMPILVPNVGASPPRYGSSLHDGVVYFSVYPISTFSHHPTDRTVMLHCNGGPWASSGANNYHPPPHGGVGGRRRRVDPFRIRGHARLKPLNCSLSHYCMQGNLRRVRRIHASFVSFRLFRLLCMCTRETTRSDPFSSGCALGFGAGNPTS